MLFYFIKLLISKQSPRIYNRFIMKTYVNFYYQCNSGGLQGFVVDVSKNYLHIEDEDGDIEKVHKSKLSLSEIKTELIHKNRHSTYKSSILIISIIRILYNILETEFILFYRRFFPYNEFATHERYRILKIISQINSSSLVVVEAGSILRYLNENAWQYKFNMLDALSERNRVEIALESLVESGDLSRSQKGDGASYLLKGKGLLTLEKYEREDKRDAKTHTINWFIAVFTFVIALQALVYCYKELFCPTPHTSKVIYVVQDKAPERPHEKLVQTPGRLSQAPGPELPGNTAVRQRDPGKPERAVRAGQATGVPGEGGAEVSPAPPPTHKRPTVKDATEPAPGPVIRPVYRPRDNP